MATPGKPLLHRFSNTLDDGSVLTDDLFAMQLGIHRLEFKLALFRNLIKKKKKKYKEQEILKNHALTGSPYMYMGVLPPHLIPRLIPHCSLVCG